MNAPQLQEILEENAVVGERRVGGRRYWTGRETLILRNHYPRDGVAGCLERLPGRTAKAIYAQAGKLGLVKPPVRKDGMPQQRWISSDAIDAVIRQRYPRATARNDVFKLAQAVGRPRWWVTKRASVLGLVAPRFKEPPWTEAEEDIARENAHKHPASIRRALKAAGFERTETAIIVKLKRIGADRTDPHHFTAHQLAQVMGVDGKTVTRWIINGWLKSKRRGTARVEVQGGDEHWIHRKDVRAFIIENAALVDIRKVEKVWFIDLLAGGA